jgi:hypothetical protein
MSKGPNGKPRGRPVGSRGIVTQRLRLDATAIALSTVYRQWNTSDIARLANRLASSTSSSSVSFTADRSLLSLDTSAAHFASLDRYTQKRLSGSDPNAAKGYTPNQSVWIQGSVDAIFKLLIAPHRLIAQQYAGALGAWGDDWPSPVLGRLLDFALFTHAKDEGYLDYTQALRRAADWERFETQWDEKWGINIPST